MTQSIKTTLISTNNLVPNKGQIYGLPKNPRFIKGERFDSLKKSISDDPEMMELRPLIVYTLGDNEKKYVVIGGNMRLKACTELGWGQIPCVILPKETPVAKLRAFTIKDNVAFGETDFDAIFSDWDADELADFGFELDSIKDIDEYGGEPQGDKNYTRKIDVPVYEQR